MLSSRHRCNWVFDDVQRAKLAARRMVMQKLRRTPDQHSKALAQANAVRNAAQHSLLLLVIDA